jgi:hypothetical protein
MPRRENAMTDNIGRPAAAPQDAPPSIRDDERAMARKLETDAGMPDWLADLLAEAETHGYTPRLIERLRAEVARIIEPGA